MRTSNSTQQKRDSFNCSTGFFLRLSAQYVSIILLFTAKVIFPGFVSGQNVITIKDTDLGNGTYNWTSNNIYLLDGFVFLEPGGVLNIEPGTVIKGKATPTTGDNASALIISSGAQIFADGTAEQPIIFTSEFDDLSDPTDLTHTDRGLWGGLIVLGDGVLGNSSPVSNVEGIPSTETRAQFGGSDNTNNAGVLRYVSIRHGGAELSPGDEINGLTLGGVGSGTTVEYIEVFANEDDGIEFFGGAVNVKYAVTTFCGDDGFDWDLGWVGKGQFWFVIQAEDASDNGGEWDGAIPDGNAVYSNPVVYNLTFIGSGRNNTVANNTNAFVMRDATAGTVANGILTDFARKALEVEDLPAGSGIDSYQRLIQGELKILNNIWFGFGSYTTFDAHPVTGIIRYTPGGEDTTCTALINHLTSNGNQLIDPQLNSISRQPNGQLDPRPKSTSPVFSDLATYPSDPFFTQVNYKGAFDGVGTNLWIKSWTALDQNGYLAPSTGGIDRGGIEQGQGISVSPNPVDAVITVHFKRMLTGKAHVTLYDVEGRKVIAYDLQEGNDRISLDTGNLRSGLYLLRVQSDGYHAVERIVVN